MTDVAARETLPGYGPMLPIIEAVTREYKISETVLVQRGQSSTPAEARRVCAWLAHKLQVRLSVEEIARALGRPRILVPRGIETTERQRATDDWLREMTDRLLVELRGA